MSEICERLEEIRKLSGNEIGLWPEDALDEIHEEATKALALLEDEPAEAEGWDGPFPQGEPWIGVDLDGTLAHYDGWVSPSHIGPPVPRVLEMVRSAVEDGQNVAIYTARVSVPEQRDEVVGAVEAWCKKHIGQVLPITCRKDFGMVACFDDRATQVVRNEGRLFVHPDSLRTQEAEPVGWRPIETAPKGGRELGRSDARLLVHPPLHHHRHPMTYTTTMDTLPRRDHSDPDAVLAAIDKGRIRRASAFELTDDLWRSLKALEERGEIRLTGGAYPWKTWVRANTPEEE